MSAEAGKIVEYLDSLNSAIFGVKAGEEEVGMRGIVR